ncbi:MAG: HEAT repeat domain-containing protein, partial [Spirochaetales bacterium]|nr:HEAT repeat domain-containing protein [Spirochaetales bacterium]
PPMNSIDLLKQLKNPSPGQREQAMIKIGNSFDTELLAPLAGLAGPDAPEIELLFIKYLLNLPPELSISHLLSLSRSPHEATRKNVFAALDQIDWEEDPELIKKLLSFDSEPLALFVLKKLEPSKKKILLSVIAPLLSSPSEAVAEAAFTLMAAWNFPASIVLILPLLKTKEPFRLVLAISTLGRLSAFTKWKRLLPFLRSPEPEVRQAAVQSIRLCGSASTYPFFLKALKQETDTGVMKELITALTGVQRTPVIRELIRLAALNPAPGVRKAANWAVNEYRGKLLHKSIKMMLNPKNETLCRFLITKIGELRLTECGHLVVVFLNPKAPGPLQYAALESLCLLKDKKYINLLKPFIKSPDAMKAYLATLAAANTVSTLDECGELKDIFFSSLPEQEVLKQTVLELMNGTLAWNPGDPAILAALKANLNNRDMNTRYLSLFLIKKTKDRSFIPLLTQKAIDDPDEVVRDTVVQCIDSLLEGDVGYYLKTMAVNQPDREQESITMKLLLRLGWDRRNALEAITFFAQKRWQYSKELTPLAVKLYQICPGEIEDFVRLEQAFTPWLLALASAWLANINPLNSENNKVHWLTLLHKNIPGLQALLVRKAIDNKSKWAVEPLQQSLDRIADPAEAGLTKEAVKTILEL